MGTSIRVCDDRDRATILEIINAAAIAYRGVIPADRWHEPYMSVAELDAELATGVIFHGVDDDGQLRGVMGIQDVGDVQLIRHAYVSPAGQRRGIGGALLEHLTQNSTRPVLVGTWAAAQWAVAFYLRHGFEQVSDDDKTRLLRRYWTVPERQIETSVVLRLDLRRRPLSSETGQVTVRVARPQDSPAIFGLARALAASFVPDQASFAQVFETLLSDPQADLLVAHHAEAAPIGYLLGFTHLTFFANGPVSWIEELTVESSQRHRGIGRMLLSGFEQRAETRGARLIALATRRAGAFYTRFGYQESATYFRKLSTS